MKLKKTFAGVVAASVAVSALAVSAFAGSATLNTTSWWAQEAISVEDLLEGNAVEDVESVTFESDIAAVFGYNSISTGEWAQVDIPANTPTDVDVSDLDYDPEIYYSCVAISTDDGVDHTITWTVNLKDDTIGGSENVAEPVIIDLANGGTMVNDGGVRINLVHPWAPEDLWDAFHIVNAADFEGTQVISVKFQVTGVTAPFDAWLAVSTNNWDGENDMAYWGPDSADNVKTTSAPLTITEDGVYVLTVYFDQPIVVAENFFFALQTNIVPDEDDEDLENVPQITILQVAKDAALTVDAEEDPTEEPTPGESSGNVEDPTDDPTPENPDNVDTGVALTVVPAALAAAALAVAGVATKKRK
ncbi:MAG: hypothetical protein J1E39_08535 [Eubacterium sp.]|nr:hypothetical protein [Eubacterium sp.]